MARVASGGYGNGRSSLGRCHLGSSRRTSWYTGTCSISNSWRTEFWTLESAQTRLPILSIAATYDSHWARICTVIVQPRAPSLSHPNLDVVHGHCVPLFVIILIQVLSSHEASVLASIARKISSSHCDIFLSYSVCILATSIHK
jgi:hypothetical protein